VIGVWNLVSVILEYTLLLFIYRQFPQLAKAKSSPVKKKKSKNWLASFKGWGSYMQHDVRNAGLALSFLYMTVLGFDNITYGYSLMQCVTESILGILVAVSAGIGIMGSLSFPFFRRRLGAAKVGLVGLWLEIAAISLCVVSIWLPGSPFDPTNPEPDAAPPAKGIERCEDANSSNSSIANLTAVAAGSCEDLAHVNFTSVGVMLTGIVLARYGLWIADLSITQIFQENVEEHQRGVLGGVQSSLNSAMDLVKFIFVLVLPYQNMFGILILLSYSFVCAGGFLMLSYNFCRKKKGEPDPGLTA
jgi:iron-regulated transporter 1